MDSSGVKAYQVGIWVLLRQSIRTLKNIEFLSIGQVTFLSYVIRTVYLAVSGMAVRVDSETCARKDTDSCDKLDIDDASADNVMSK